MKSDSDVCLPSANLNESCDTSYSSMTTRGTVGTEGQRTSGYRGPEEQWEQRTRGLVGIEDQRNSGNTGPEDQWVQRTRGPVGI